MRFTKLYPYQISICAAPGHLHNRPTGPSRWRTEIPVICLTDGGEWVLMQWDNPSFKMCQNTIYANGEDICMHVEMETDSYPRPHAGFWDNSVSLDRSERKYHLNSFRRHLTFTPHFNSGGRSIQSYWGKSSSSTVERSTITNKQASAVKSTIKSKRTQCE